MARMTVRPTGLQTISGPSISVSIVNYNTWDDVRSCVSQLRKTGQDLDCELQILVWDNGSGPMPPAESLGADEVHGGMGNLGYGAGNNKNLERATGAFFLILNPDTRMAAKAAVTMSEALLADPSVGMVAPRLLGADGGVQDSCRRLPRLRHEVFRSLLLDQLLPRRFNDLMMNGWAHDERRVVEQPAGAALMLRTADLRALGGFDERFFMYFEDVDLCARVRSQLGDILFLPSAEVVHVGEGTARRYRRETTRAIEVSRLLYYARHERSWPTTVLVRLCVAVTCVSRALLLGLGSLPGGGASAPRRARALGYASVLPHLFDGAESLSKVGRE